MGTGENAGGKPCDGLASHPGFMLRKPEISAGLMGLPRLVTETLPFTEGLPKEATYDGHASG